MGATVVYLLPELGDLVPQTYAARARAVLIEMEVIDAEPMDFDPMFFPPGEASLAPFDNEVDWTSGFESCGIYGNGRAALVPNDPAVDPCCPKCGVNVSELYYEVVNDAAEFEPDKPEADLRVRCPRCAEDYRLDQLVDDVGIFLVNAYVAFDDIPGALKREWLAAFDKSMRVSHRVIEYWYT